MSDRQSFSVYDAFKAVDANNDGRVTKDDLRRMIEGRSGAFTVSNSELN